MNLADERRMLRDAREYLSAIKRADAEEYLAEMTERFGVALVDQLKAARTEAERDRATLGMSMGLSSPGTAVNPALVPMLFAATVRCVATHACEHATLGDRPLIALLGPRMISCYDCLSTFYSTLKAHDERVGRGEETLCDFCLEEPEDLGYRPVMVTVGPCNLRGDICDACVALCDIPADAP